MRNRELLSIANEKRTLHRSCFLNLPLILFQLFGDEALETKLEDITAEDFGEVGEAVITKDDTMFLRGKGKPEDVQKRCEQIKDELESTNSEYEKEKLNERLAKLSDGVAIIKVGLTRSSFATCSHELTENFQALCKDERHEAK